jgi:hypothetical protein
MLTTEQLLHAQMFGFVLLRQCFSPEEMSKISADFDEVLAEDRQGRPFPGEQRQGVLGFAEQRPALMRLLEDDRIYGAIEQLLGPEFVWIGSDGNLYVGDTGWHPDSSAQSHHYPRVKVAFYLDPVTKDTGCLRVIPGSHHRPFFDDLFTMRDLDGDTPSYPLESQPGDVVMFYQNLWHSSWGGATGRRMFTLNFGAKPMEDSHVKLLQDFYRMNMGFIRDMGWTQRDWMYGDLLRSDRPRLRSMSKKLVELGLR